MPIILKLSNNADEMKTVRNAVVLNDIPLETISDRTTAQNYIFTKLGTDGMSSVPSCGCGYETSVASIGAICKKCNTMVTEKAEDAVESLVWVRSAKGIAKLINPSVLSMLQSRFRKPGFDTLRWIMDPTYKPESVNSAKFVAALEARGLTHQRRGYNSFVNNIVPILRVLLGMKMFKIANDMDQDFVQYMSQATDMDWKAEDVILFQQAYGDVDIFDPESIPGYIEANLDSILSDELPLPNKSLLVVEQIHVTSFIDPIVRDAIDAINILFTLDHENLKQRVKEARTVKGLFALADYYKNFVNKHLSGKFGLMRRHLFGTRMPYTFRVVISSSTGPHVYDEIVPPWSATVGVLEDHLISKLVRRRFKLNDAIALIHSSVERYNSLIHELINEIISESVYNVVDIQDLALYGKPLENINGRASAGISATKTRYPSLTKGSTLQVRMPRVKTDPNDHTFDQPILTVVPLNADFDGDQMTVQLALDTMMQRLMVGFAPHRTIYDLSTPRTPSGTIAQPKPLVATTGNWLKHMRAPREIDPVKAQKMAALAKRS